MARRKVANLTGLAILALLMPGRPMHPYQMATMLRRTGKDHDFKIKWGSLYTVVQNLEKHGFIEPTESARDGRRPERTAYAITDTGRAEARDWLAELVGEPEPEFPRFTTALSVLGVLDPDTVAELLAKRITALDQRIAADRAALAEAAHVPRIFLIEGEYAIAMTMAEVAWVRGLLDEITSGTLAGVDDWRRYHQTGEVLPEFLQMIDEGDVG
jgi:DNA-binding PadR family transcriptional regulator